MAPQKQARRNAVSAKKRAGHGNNRAKGQVSYSQPAVVASQKTEAAGTGPGRAAFRPRTKAWAGTAGASEQASSAGDPAGLDASAPLPRRIFGWIREHPLPLATWILSMLGLGVSIYLTVTHYDTSITLACSDKGLVNCEAVTTSPQSMVFGIFPVAVLGLAFYCFMFAINSPLGWSLNRIPLVRWLRLGSAVVGIGFVLYLVYAELIQIGNICLWCTSVHVLTFLMFVLLVYDATSWASPAASRRL
jgi:uncharacterized membrane protein